MRAKLHNSEKWMRLKYVSQKKDPQEIANEAGVSLATVYAKLKAFGLIK